MSLTPVDVRNVAFSKAPIGKPSYHKDEVDDLLDLVEAALVRLIEENNDLRNHAEQVEQQLRAVPADVGRDFQPLEALRPVMTLMRPLTRKTTCPSAAHNAQVTKVLGVAQRTADQLADAADAEACRMLSQAQTEGEHLLAEARVKARNMVNDARTRAETMLCDARTAAETLERQSWGKAESLEQDATRERTEILDVLRGEKRLLEKNIDELRAFAQEYRTRMTTYAQSQLQKLDEAASDTSVKPVRTQQGLLATLGR
ncbi:MAG: DivIVA domain-containing protein [Pseudonocardiaceae bacterium]